MSLACWSTLVVLVLTQGLWPIPAHAESVPGHIVSMTKELLLATQDDFKAATGNDEQAQRLQRIYRILRREGLYNWRLTSITRDGFVPKMAAVFGLSQIGSAETEKFKKFLEAQTGGRFDAAIDELYTALGRARLTGAARKRVVDGWNALWAETWASVALTYEMEASRGPQTITLTWDMDRARFTIRVMEEGDAKTKKMQTTITGLVQFAFDQKAQNLIVSVRPAQMPITSGNPDIQTATAQPVETRLGPPDEPSGERVEHNGNASVEQKQIDVKRRRIEEIKEVKGHVWENTETKEKIRQKRFSQLQEPFEYKGKGYATDEAENEVVRLEKEIAALVASMIPGTWRSGKGEIWEISFAGGGGKDLPPSERPENRIAELERQIEKIMSDKVFRWKNTETGEDVLQDKFRRLKEPFEFLGHGLRRPDGKAEIARLMEKIKKLSTPVVASDPIGMKKMRVGGKAQPLNIRVTRKDGYSWTYDEATLSNGRIKASRTLRSPRDSPHLPVQLMRHAIAYFFPPQWVELDLKANAETGDVYLSGQVWNMHVTHTNLKVDSIHTPFSRPLALRRERFKLSSITITDETFRNELQKVMPGGRFWISAKGSGGNSDIVERVRVSVYSEEAGESEWIEVELVETGPDTLEFHSSPEGILVVASEEEEEEYEEEEIEEEIDGEKDEGLPSASSYDPDTGITTTSQRNPDGSRTVTQTDKDGNVISNKTLPPRGKGTSSASSYDPETGITTKSQGNPDGSRTVTRTDKKGKVISSEKVK